MVKKIISIIIVVAIAAIAGSALFSFGQISSRYFVILIPVLYVTALYGIIEVAKLVKK